MPIDTALLAGFPASVELFEQRCWATWAPTRPERFPALEQALKMHRVIYAAEEAIHKIKGEPTPTWY